MQRDRVKSVASWAVVAEKRWMAQLQSFGSKWRLHREARGGDRLDDEAARTSGFS